MKDILIIDNSPGAYLLNPDNALPIKSWYGDSSDQVLLGYVPFLVSLSKMGDARPILKSVNSVSREGKINVKYGLRLME